MINHIQDTLDSLKSKFPEAGICILGDMNRLDVTQLCINNTLAQVVDKPTRGDAILDKIITNLDQFYTTPTIETPIGLSDHSTVSWLPKHNLKKQPNKTVTRSVRPIKDSGLREFGTWIVNHDWQKVLKHNNAIDSANAFYDTIHQRMERQNKTACY